MAKTYLTPDELVQGNKWLKTVFFPCIRNNTTDYVDPWYANTVVRACNTVYKFIVERLWDTNDSLRNELENFWYKEHEKEGYEFIKTPVMIFAIIFILNGEILTLNRNVASRTTELIQGYVDNELLKNATATAPGPTCVPITLPIVE